MERAAVLLSILLVIAAAAFAQESSMNASFPVHPLVPRSDAEKKIVAMLDRMVSQNETYLSVPPEDGAALCLFAEAVSAKRVVEIGTSTGYSGLWFCLALQRTGGRLTTFELDHGRATMARKHFDAAGVGDLVTIVEGDAHVNVAKLRGAIDLAFIDAEKPGYMDYLSKVLPLVRSGGLILAHNVDLVPDYVKAVTTNPELETIFYMQGNKIAVSLRRR